MKRTNPQTGEVFKKGDVREDGRIFLSYQIARGIKRDGYFGEHWVTPESFKNCKEAISKNKKLKSKTKQGTTIEMLCGAKSRAKAKNLPFDLDLQYVRSIINDKCPIFNFELKWDNPKQMYNSPSLDRIIPELGYVKGNVQIISNLANTMKSNASVEQLLTFSKWITETYGTDQKSRENIS